MRTALIGGAVFAVILTAAHSGADSRTGAEARAAAACAADVIRFCPRLVTAYPGERLLCLKPFAVDVSPGCRRALASADDR